MRLWHEQLIHKLPRQQLLGQHRELAALRGNGWGKNHATVNYVFNYPPYKLYQFHVLVMDEMQLRGYHPNKMWYDPNYRGQFCAPYEHLAACALTVPVYPEHNTSYLKECLLNLKTKGIILSSND